MSSDEQETDVDAGTKPTDDWQNITKPGPHDVLCGRGGGTNNHSGNVKFRQMINDHKLRYLAASKVEKPKVAREVVKLWRALDPAGRFFGTKGRLTERTWFGQSGGQHLVRRGRQEGPREGVAVPA